MKRPGSALYSTYIIDGTQMPHTPAQMLESCMDECDYGGELPENFESIVDETTDPAPKKTLYSADRIPSYVDRIREFKESIRPEANVSSKSYTKRKIAAALTDALWKKGHFMLEDLGISVGWKWNCAPLGNMAAFYFSAEAASEYIFDLNVRLECRQINSGIRLKVSPDFLTAFPDGVLFVSSDEGSLMYGYSEKRIAYFNPGTVSVIMNDGGSSRTLMTRTLSAREILTVGIYVSDDIQEEDSGTLSISIDTARIWNDESYVIGASDDGKGNTPENAMSVNQARASIGDKDVWVCGYIVGGDLSKSSVSFQPPFSSRTNIAVATRSTASDKSVCLSVSLPDGDLRDALNLVDHPENLGRRLYLNGDIVESYFGLVGIKNVSDYILK